MCPAHDLACGNGKERTEHLSELFGDDWYTWPMENKTHMANHEERPLQHLAALQHEHLDSLLRAASA
ncbi:MAG TPA: DUF3079 domain-containing protein, partial [Polyangiales bacterium]|nr:DUF3079 domain-containing protein [Polyangiales bacterium]